MGIVYDLIPLLFPDRYLSNANVRRTYFEALQVLRDSDHLFAISHATRQDTIRHAAVDPRRVHCVYGDIDQTKQALMNRPASETAAVPAMHGLVGPYCAYVGGDDWRKNLDTAVNAFAAFHREHPAHQLAIVCKLSGDRIAAIQRRAGSLGLPPGAVRCTGFVTDEDLVGLVRHADMVVFPSLYEGLGLPVLEAYGCGTPVVGSNNSSVAELVLPELACDPQDPSAIAAAMKRLADSDQLREASLALGRRLQAEELGWSRAAERVMEQIESHSRVVAAVRHPHGSDTGADVRRSAAVVTSRLTAAASSEADIVKRLHASGMTITRYQASRHPLSFHPPGKASADRDLPIEALPAALLRDHDALVVFAVSGRADDATIEDAIMRTRGTRARRILCLLDESPRLSMSLADCIEKGEIDAAIAETPAGRALIAEAEKAIGRPLATTDFLPAAEMAPGSWIEPITVQDLHPMARVRVEVTLACRDCDPIPKVPGAGRVRCIDGRRVQLMHEGSLIDAGGYCGDWMTRIIADLRGHHEPQEELAFRALLRHVRHGSLFVELGAWWAYYTTWYLRAVPGSHAVCVEPDPANLDVGRFNLAINGQHARFLRACIGETARSARDPDEVECLDMPALQALVSGERIEVLHMDVQGSEAGFLRSMRKTAVADCLRFVVASTHHESISGSPSTHEECLAEFDAQGALILAEHSVAESFSGDGLIVASFDRRDASIRMPAISRAPAAWSGRIWQPPPAVAEPAAA
jgi:hypothetical protein